MKKTLPLLTQCVKPFFFLFLSNFVVSSICAQTNGDMRNRYNTAAGSIATNAASWESYSSTTGLWTNTGSTSPAALIAGQTFTIRDGVNQTANGNNTYAYNTVVGEGNAASAVATISGGAVTAVTIVNPGKLTSIIPSITFVSSLATTTAVASITSFSISDYEITNPGSGYTTVPTVTVGTVWPASTAVSVNNQRSNGGNLYTCTTAGTTDVSGGPTGTGTGIVDGTAIWSYAGTAATATATTGTVTLGTTTYTNGVTSLTITNQGSGYNAYPGITLSGGTPTVAATARPKLGVLAVTITNGGAGYTSAPMVFIGSTLQIGNNTNARTATYTGSLEFKVGANLVNPTAQAQVIIMANDLTLGSDIYAFTPQISTQTNITTFTCTKASGTVNIIGPGKLFAKTFNVSTGGTALSLGSNTGLIIASGSTANFNGQSVTLKSSATGTASIVNNGTISNATNVTLQQWVTGQRGYRVLSNPFTTTLDAATVGTTNSISITGASDVRTYNGVANTWSSTSGSNAISANTPYAVFVRGLASEVSGLTYSAGPTSFAYGVTGTINTGAVTGIAQNATGFTMIGNPYAAPINSSALTGGTVGTPYYVYSMAQNNTGVRVKAGGWVAASSNSSTSTTIPTMGVVAYQAASGATFGTAQTDINTSGTAQTGLFGESEIEKQLELQLNKDANYQDKLFVRLNAGASDLGNERMDLAKLSNDVTNIYTITSDKAHLAVDARKGIDASIPVGITAPAGSYTFTVASNNLPNSDNVYLLDKLLNTKTVLVPGATYSFAITADAGSKGDDRFELGTVKTAIPEIVANEAFSVKVLGNVVNNAVTLQVKGAKAAVTITVTDIQGKIISNTTSSNVVNTLSLASGSGMYFIKVTDGENSVVNKVVKP